MGLKVCMFVSNDCRNDSRVLREAATLVGSGLDVTICATPGTDLPLIDTAAGASILRVPSLSWRQRLGRGTGPGSKSDHARRRGPVARVLRPIRQLASAMLQLQAMVAFHRACVDALQGSRIDICHAHDLDTLPVANAIARRHGAKLVYDSHELFVDRAMDEPQNQLLRRLCLQLERHLARRCDAVITVNGSLARELSHRLGIDPPTVVMNVPSLSDQPAPTSRRVLRDAIGADDAAAILIYTGAIIPRRGLEQVIAALRELPACRLVLLGYGDRSYKDRLRHLADAARLGSRVSFLGPVPPEDVLRHVAGADLAVAPIQNVNLSYYLCLPNKLFEAIAAGVPVIASDFHELRRVVLGFDVGLTFDPADPSDIARAARTILDDPQRRAQMRQNTTRAVARYNWARQGAKLTAVYERLAAGGPAGDRMATRDARRGRRL